MTELKTLAVTLEQLEKLLSVVADGRTLFQYNHHFDNESDKQLVCALRNAAPALIAVVHKSKAASPEMICTCHTVATCARCNLLEALKAFDEVKL